jgi:PUA-domain protein
MSEIRIRKRRRLREKEIKALSEEVAARAGTPTFGLDDTIDMADSSEFDVVFVNGEIDAFVIGGKAFLTVRGLLKYHVPKGFVEVDMGAIKYVVNGADVMGPGIVDADPGITPGDMVWIRDEKNKRPLAVGEALASGADMKATRPGKAVKNILYVGDKLWKYEER